MKSEHAVYNDSIVVVFVIVNHVLNVFLRRNYA